MSELMLHTVVMKGADPVDPEGRPERLFGTWKVVAASAADAIELVDRRLVPPFLRGCGPLTVTGSADYPKPVAPGVRLVVTFVRPPSFNGGAPTEWEAYTDDGKVWRWVSNDQCLFDDTCWEVGVPVDFEAQEAARTAQNAQFLTQYRAQQASRSRRQVADDRAATRAAVGRGKRMVNAVTGERYTT